MARKTVGSWADDLVFIPDEQKIDESRVKVLSAIRREKRRPASRWREVLESRSPGYTRVDVTTGDVVEAQ